MMTSADYLRPLSVRPLVSRIERGGTHEHERKKVMEIRRMDGFITTPILEVTSELPKKPIASWEELLKTVTYKAGYEFIHQYLVDYGQDYIFVELTTKDTYNPDSPYPFRVVHRNPVPDFKALSEVEAREFLRAVIHSVETHEADEWLRFGGVMLFDPHRAEQ